MPFARAVKAENTYLVNPFLARSGEAEGKRRGRIKQAQTPTNHFDALQVYSLRRLNFKYNVLAWIERNLREIGDKQVPRCRSGLLAFQEGLLTFYEAGW